MTVPGRSSQFRYPCAQSATLSCGHCGAASSTIARYELIDRATGSIVYTQDVSASGEVPFNYASAGVIRARESISRSAQNNIAQFLQSLETVDISKLMFPNKQEAP